MAARVVGGTADEANAAEARLVEVEEHCSWSEARVSELLPRRASAPGPGASWPRAADERQGAPLEEYRGGSLRVSQEFEEFLWE